MNWKLQRITLAVTVKTYIENILFQSFPNTEINLMHQLLLYDKGFQIVYVNKLITLITNYYTLVLQQQQIICS